MQSCSSFKSKWRRTNFFFNNSRPKLHYFFSSLSFMHFWRWTIKYSILIYCLKNSFSLVRLESKSLSSFLCILKINLLSSGRVLHIIEIWNIRIIWKFTLILVTSCWSLLCLNSAWLRDWIIMIKRLWVIIIVPIG